MTEDRDIIAAYERHERDAGGIAVADLRECARKAAKNEKGEK